MVSDGHLTAKGQRTRRRLLEAAAAELLERGLIEVAAVADRAQVSVGLLYRYFASKDGLIVALVDEFYDRYEDAVFTEAAPVDVHWSDFESQRIAREIDFVFDEPLGRRIVGGLWAEPAAAHADARRLARHVDMATRNIVHGQRRGDIEVLVDPRLAASAIIGGLRSCLATALADGSDLSRSAVADAVEQSSNGLIKRMPR